MKKIFALLMVFAVLLSLSLAVCAKEVPQERDDCIIELLVRYDGENVDGGTLTAIKVGYVDEDDGNYFFSQEFTDTKIEDVASSNAAKAQLEFYENNRDNYDFYIQTQPVVDGKATFTGLSTGLYLMIQEQAAPDFSKLDAFLVSIPYQENGEYRYHVIAAVKSEIEQEPETEPSTEPTIPDIPQTGQLNWPVPIMAASGLACFVIGWLLYFDKKRDQYEK